MLYSKNLLSRFLSIQTDPEDIEHHLTLKSCEVEETHVRTLPELVVVGKVLEVREHPNADKLVICQLDCGSKGTYQICTGAKNVVADSFVPVALPGCYLPAINLKIEPRQMRGEDSNGMICSKEELGIGEDIGHHWIWTLQSKNGLRTQPGKEDDGSAGDVDFLTDKDVGSPLKDIFPRLEGRVLDVENKTITHRPELFGHFGLALELNAIFPKAITFQNIQKHVSALQSSSIFETLENAEQGEKGIRIESDNVLSYTLCEIKNITTGKSDFFTRLLLADLGIQHKMNWVDMSNIFMYLTGQPVHFFDADKINGDVIVRQARDGETFTDLFEKEHTLTSKDLVITDQDKILCLAGIIGSNSSGVDKNTKNIAIEIANFDAVTVRKTGTRLGLRTDAEIRYEKYINPLYTLYALHFLLDEIAYFKKSLGEYEIGGLQWRVNEQKNVRVLSSVNLEKEHMLKFIHGENTLSETEKADFLKKSQTLLEAIGLSVAEKEGTRKVVIPGRRSPDDLTCDADIIEEITRLYGYENIGHQEYTDKNIFVPFPTFVSFQRQAEELISGTYGYTQIETYPRLDQRRHDFVETNNLLTLKNPLAPENDHLRNQMIWSIIEVAEKNAPVYDSLHVFDIGKTREKNRQDQEHDVLGVGIWNKKVDSLQGNGLLSLKKLIQDVTALHTEVELVYEHTTNEYFHPVQQGHILLDGKKIGTIGVVHPLLLEQIKLPTQGQLVVAELDLTLLQQIESKTSETSYSSLQDQLIQRDLSVLVPNSIGFGKVKEIVTSVDQIEDIEIFDIYTGEGVPENQKSISFSFTLLGTGKTTTEEINSVMETVIKKLQEQDIHLRG